MERCDFLPNIGRFDNIIGNLLAQPLNIVQNTNI